MNLTQNLRRKLKASFKLISLGIPAGILFVAFADGFESWYPFVNGSIIGLLIAIIVSVFEFNIYENYLRKKSFIILLLTRSLFYLFFISLIVVAEIGIARMIKENLDFKGLMENETFNQYLFGGRFASSFIYAFGLIITINFTRQVSRKLGHKVFISLITGRYYRPKEMEKIFMFVNIPNSEKIVRRIGRMDSHRMINEIVFDITLPILNNRGIIYQYVDGEMVIEWGMGDGMKNANVIRCFFEIKKMIEDQSQKYLRKFDAIPQIKAAVHCGKVVKGEIGLFKSEIVYHGDVMNTTSRILGVCHKMDSELLVSEELLNLLKLPDDFFTEKCGSTKLKGKKEPLELVSIQQENEKTESLIA